jgi:hypothetical protein
MDRTVPITAVIVIIAIVLLFAFSSYIFPQTPNSVHLYSEKQMWITTGIQRWTNLAYPSSSSVPQIYDLVTSVRSVTNSPVTNITATLRISSPPVVVTEFFQGIALVTPIVPLGWNRTAYVGVTDLTPPSGGFQLGQTFPETVAVTFRNGTSVEFDLFAQVFQAPTY